MSKSERQKDDSLKLYPISDETKTVLLAFARELTILSESYADVGMFTAAGIYGNVAQQLVNVSNGKVRAVPRMVFSHVQRDDYY